MAKQIKSVKVFRADNNRSVEVIVNFDDRSQGRVYKTRDGKFVHQNMTDEELQNARSLAIQGGKWQNYEAKASNSKPQAQQRYSRNRAEDARDDLDEYEQFVAKHPSTGRHFSFGPMNKEG